MKKLSLLAAVLGLLCSGVSPAAITCPSLGVSANCDVTITLNVGGTGTVSSIGGNYDGVEDVLVGVLNSSGATVNAITISGTGIFALDGDGGWASGTNGCYSGTGTNTYGCYAPSVSTDPGDYSGPTRSGNTAGSVATTFTISTANLGGVNFTGGLANNAQTYFTLEAPPTGSTFTVTIGGVPEPSSVFLLGTALLFVGGFLRRKV